MQLSPCGPIAGLRPTCVKRTDDVRDWSIYGVPCAHVHAGLSMAAYMADRRLQDFFDVLSLSLDKSGNACELLAHVWWRCAYL